MRAKITKGIFIITIVIGVYTPLLAQWNENFSDNEFTTNPEWKGSITDFRVEGEILRLDAPPMTSSSFLVTESDISVESEWNFRVKLDFNPSSSNYSMVYLMADLGDLDSVQNGYFVKIGGTTDEVSLYKVVDGAETIMINGIDGRVGLSSVEVTLQITRDSNHVWNLKNKLLGESDFFSEGTSTDADLQSSSYFGFYCKYTSTRSSKFYFDDVLVSGSPYLDMDPPGLLMSKTQSLRKIILSFNEELDSIEAKSINRYKLNDSQHPLMVEYFAKDSLVLEFGNDLDLVNSLELIAIPDLEKNTLDTTIQVVYVDQAPYSYRDLVINEILPDPNPQEDLPASEFLELFNTSNRIIDLEGWQYTDGTKVETFTSHLIYPDSFLIICPSAAMLDFQTFGTTIGLTNWPTLNNSGDGLLLTDRSGTTIDSLTYLLGWYKDSSKDDGGWSLEQINPTVTMSEEDNWVASIQAGGGTPGRVNSVFDLGKDEAPPILTATTTPSRSEIKLVFNEHLDSITSLDPLNYKLNGSIIPVSVIQQSLDTIRLNLNSPIDLANILTIQNLSDASGNLLDTTVQIYFIDTSPYTYRDVSINEIFADPNPQEDLPLFEFVELLNTSDRIIDLKNFQFSDGSKTSPLESYLLFPDSILIICGMDALESYKAYGETMALGNWPSLNNEKEVLKLTSTFGMVIDSLTYEQSWYKSSTKKNGGWSLEQINPHTKCFGLYNWDSSISSIGGTPGKVNSVFAVNTDFEAPHITLALVTDLLLEVWLSEPVLKNSINGVITPNGLGVEFKHNKESNFLSSHLLDSLYNGNTYKIEIPLEDCHGNNGVDSAEIIIIEDPSENNIIINEVLFNPHTNGSDFVEILNTTAHFFNLKKFTLSNLDHNVVISDTTLLLKPNAYMGISEDIRFLKNHYLAPDSSLIETNLPAMPNQDGVVILKSTKNKVIDSVYYSENYHFSLIADVKGISLERISTIEDSNNQDNWKSAAETVGFASPGYENSQSRKLNSIGHVSVSPEVITPNNDGQNDFSQISFSLDSSSRTISIQVFNINGQLVKTITNNALISPNGFFTWDGTNDQGGILPTAHYVIVSEIIRSDGQIQNFRNKVVVANGF